MHPKLLDFGLALLHSRNAKTLGATLRWATLEVFGESGIMPRAATDVFSFGHLVFYVATAKKPLRGIDDKTVRRMARESYVLRPEWPSICSSFMKQCQPLVEKASTTIYQNSTHNGIIWPE